MGDDPSRVSKVSSVESTSARRMRPEPGRIEIKIPGRPEYVAVVRLAAAAIAGRTAMTFEDIEDLKIAVGEVCSAAVVAGAPDVAVIFNVAPEHLEVRVTHRPARAPRQSKEMELNRLLVQLLMDEVQATVDGAEHVTRMIKRVTQTQPGRARG